MSFTVINLQLDGKVAYTNALIQGHAQPPIKFEDGAFTLSAELVVSYNKQEPMPKIAQALTFVTSGYSCRGYVSDDPVPFVDNAGNLRFGVHFSK